MTWWREEQKHPQHGEKMPKHFWVEVIDCAIYLSNRCPTKSLNDMTPQEAWSRRKPNVSHLKVFGSIG
jgi:hypothetical protein